MTCWTSSSARTLLVLALGLLPELALGVQAAGGQPEPPAARRLADVPPQVPPEGRATRIALLPVDNLAGTELPGGDISLRIEAALARAGLEVVSGDLVGRFLARRRIRSVGGIDLETATAALEELDVRGVLVCSVLQWSDQAPPHLAVILRLVSTGRDPTVFWIDGDALAGDDARGLFNLRLVSQIEILEQRAFARLASSLAEFLDGRGPRATPSQGGRRYRPRTSYRGVLPPADRAATVVVLPFKNLTERSFAGEILALELVRQLAAVDRFTVMEPGVVRQELLSRHVVMQGGVSNETARVLLASLEADFVVAGSVRSYVDAVGGAGAPRLDFTLTMLDAHTGKVAWQSTSFAGGSDGVLVFELGKVRTASELAAAMMREVVDQLTAADVGEEPTARDGP